MMVVWVLFPKYEVLEDPPILEHLVEPKGEDCFQVLPFVLPPMHDIQVCGELVTKPGFTRQLEDPLGMVVTRESLGYGRLLVFGSSNRDWSSYIRGACV